MVDCGPVRVTRISPESISRERDLDGLHPGSESSFLTVGDVENIQRRYFFPSLSWHRQYPSSRAARALAIL